MSALRRVGSLGAGRRRGVGAPRPRRGSPSELLHRLRRRARTGSLRAGRLGDAALLALPAVLTVYAAFNAGGFYAGTQGVLAVVMALVLVVRVTVAADPFAGAGLWLCVAAGAMALLGGWILLSATWSHAPARALLEFDRALLYVLVLLVFGSLAMTPLRLAWMVRGLALAATVVCGAGLVTRALPDVWPIALGVDPWRLAYPVTYWNTLGLLGSLGAVLCVHLTCSGREPGWVRESAAGALPVLASTIYFTLSRGAIAAGAIGLAAYLVLGRPRALAGGVLAAGPFVAAAVAGCYDAQALVSADPTSSEAVADGERAAAVVALCALGAAMTRRMLATFDPRLSVPRPYGPIRRGSLAAAAVGVLAAAVALGGPRWVEQGYALFVGGGAEVTRADPRQRILDLSHNGRVDQWRAAYRAYRAAPWTGAGAGTYQLVWDRHRPYRAEVFDAHSLYLESLAELGVPGLALVAVTLLTLIGGAACRIRGPDRTLFAAILAAMVAWAVRAGVDWDWEMPVVTLWLFAVGGAALATPRWRAGGRRALRSARGAVPPGPRLRLPIAVGCLVLAVTPARVTLSQGHLNRSDRAFERGDCLAAIEGALDSIAMIGLRPEPYEILGWCDLRLGRPRLAVRVMSEAVQRDPRHWEYHYGLAVARGAAGLDPLGPALEAARRNPRQPVAARAVEDFYTPDRALWQLHAATSSPPR